ncbi:glycosyltransferase family 2 protein [Lactococcus raffinolactis]|uniref:glycosyltransferase family 2 protein n=1 Tax=Pseudolactococcus raffinolactis TaxID=1366 RepID=UPI00288DB40B|nr:glycosyltransferase family 2 protein [Lactococcus raffinolactis]MDT2767084.1 glycosyltransferase family 2 protein [Lactococcus raffinolactis]MDT2790220.1 glycosyltransferase family 2 protein [Lactococcus raffinolactis]
MITALDEEFEAYQYSLESSVWQESLPTFQFYASENVSSTPKVSVIIANFNNESYLNNMMDSLVQQTIGLEQLQIMFIDDKSTDDSLEIIRPYVEHYQSIEVYALDQNTGGAHGPRNVGILNARGDYLVFLDADDWYDLDALRYLSQLLDASGDDFAVSGLVQSRNGEISLKSKPYFYDGDFKNRSIQDLPAEFYGWLGPQAIMLRRSLVIENELHFVNQRVADDVTFFYEAMRFAKTITQGKELTTYLNRDADNVSLSKSINRQFMISWLRALSYINMTFPGDISKERFLARRIEWLIHDFCLKRDIGYKFSKMRLQDFKSQLDRYLGTITFDPSPYFRNDFRKTAWQYLTKNDISGLYRFILLFSVRWVLNRKLGMKTRKQDTYYFPQLFRGLIETRLDAYAEAVSYADGKIKAKVFSYKEVVGFEIYDIKRPYGTRMQLIHQRESENEYQITLPDDYDDNKKRFVVVFEDYSEIGVQDFRKVFIKED